MGTTQIKEELYHFIEIADTRLLKMLHAVAKEYSLEDFTLPGEPMSEETFKERIRDARSRMTAGKFTAHEDLEREMIEW